jgi:hypothetical protein
MPDYERAIGQLLSGPQPAGADQARLHPARIGPATSLAMLFPTNSTCPAGHCAAVITNS